MALATLPPVIEALDFEPHPAAAFVTKLFSGETLTLKPQHAWKTVAFSRLATLEHGRNIPGAGDFRVSEEAANQLRIYVDRIDIASLPIPSVVPLSGRGVLLSWQSGSRTVELTTFASGEIIPEALENNEPNEDLSESDPETLLKWLVKAPVATLMHAPTR